MVVLPLDRRHGPRRGPRGGGGEPRAAGGARNRRKRPDRLLGAADGLCTAVRPGVRHDVVPVGVRGRPVLGRSSRPAGLRGATAGACDRAEPADVGLGRRDGRRPMTESLTAVRERGVAAQARHLRVLHLGFEDPRMPGSGGGSVRTREIDRRLVADGLSVTVLTTRYPGCADGIYDGVRYEHVGIGRGSNRLTRLLGYMAVLPSEVRAHREIDLVVEDFLPPFSSMAVPLWTRRPVIGMVQWLHAGEKARQYKLPFHLVERAAVRTHRSMIAVSQGTAERLAALNPAAALVVIGNGVDRELLSQPAQLGRDVLCLGRLELEGKGMDLLLPAWARVSQHIDGDLVIAGR